MKTQPSNRSISVFIPLYKDEYTVNTVVEKSIETLRELTTDYEIIIVDDGSPDKAGQIADQLSAKHEFIKVIHHKQNRGYGAAMRTGFANASYEWVCTVDGDDEYDIRDLKKLFPFTDTCDLIITARRQRLYSSYRIFISTIYNILLRILFGIKFKDINSGLRLVRRSILSDINLHVNSPFIGAELLIKASKKGHKIHEVEIETFPRKFGTGSATSPKNIVATIIDMMKVFFTLS